MALLHGSPFPRVSLLSSCHSVLQRTARRARLRDHLCAGRKLLRGSDSVADAYAHPTVCISAAVALSSVFDTYIDPTVPEAPEDDKVGAAKKDMSAASSASMRSS